MYVDVRGESRQWAGLERPKSFVGEGAEPNEGSVPSSEDPFAHRAQLPRLGPSAAGSASTSDSSRRERPPPDTRRRWRFRFRFRRRDGRGREGRVRRFEQSWGGEVGRGVAAAELVLVLVPEAGRRRGRLRRSGTGLQTHG
jgi:hypothetical protein